MMTMRERVYASIRRKGFDAIPWQFDLTEAVARRVERLYGAEDWREATDDHIVWVNYRTPARPQEGLPADVYRSEFGAIWKRSPRDTTVGDWGELLKHPLAKPSLEGYRFPDPGAVDRWTDVAGVRARYPDRFVMAAAPGLFEVGWSICGFENYLSYIAGEPVFIRELNDRLAEVSCGITRTLAGRGADGVRFGDDWGFQDRLMMRPEVWRRLYKPYYRRIYEAAREAALVVAVHSCGNITDILGDLADIGVEVVHPLQPEVMNVEHCAREFGRDLSFWGGLGSQSTLPLGGPEDVRREVRDRLELFANGGYILAPAGAAPAETPAGNIAAIVDEARAQLSRAEPGHLPP